MVARANSCGLIGIAGQLIMVEVDMAGGLPSYDTVGLPDKAVSESRERVRSAIRNSHMNLPPSRITVNLAPADLRKEGTVYDLPIALCILAACGVIENASLEGALYVGELALDGDIRPVHGVLSMAITARGKRHRPHRRPRAERRGSRVCRGHRGAARKESARTVRRFAGQDKGRSLSALPLGARALVLWRGF